MDVAYRTKIRNIFMNLKGNIFSDIDDTAIDFSSLMVERINQVMNGQLARPLRTDDILFRGDMQYYPVNGKISSDYLNEQILHHLEENGSLAVAETFPFFMTMLGNLKELSRMNGGPGELYMITSRRDCYKDPNKMTRAWKDLTEERLKVNIDGLFITPDKHEILSQHKSPIFFEDDPKHALASLERTDAYVLVPRNPWNISTELDARNLMPSALEKKMQLMDSLQTYIGQRMFYYDNIVDLYYLSKEAISDVNKSRAKNAQQS